MAWKWPKCTKKSTGAIIIFKLSNCDIFSNAKGMTFDTDTKEWKKLVSFFRSKKDEKWVDNNMSESKKLKRLDYIFGPIADGGISRSSLNPKAIKPKKYQLCLKTQDIADDFYMDGKNVYKVIYFVGNQKVETKDKRQRVPK